VEHGWIQTNVWWALRTYWPASWCSSACRSSGAPSPPHRGDGAALDSRNEVKALAMLGGVKWASDAPDFQGGEITAVMGGAHLDLRRATLRNRAVLDTFAMWGGIELVVPDTLGRRTAGHADPRRLRRQDTRPPRPQRPAPRRARHRHDGRRGDQEPGLRGSRRQSARRQAAREAAGFEAETPPLAG
jgi:hypothetical protein